MGMKVIESLNLYLNALRIIYIFNFYYFIYQYRYHFNTLDSLMDSIPIYKRKFLTSRLKALILRNITSEWKTLEVLYQNSKFQWNIYSSFITWKTLQKRSHIRKYTDIIKKVDKTDISNSSTTFSKDSKRILILRTINLYSIKNE
ncbi:hypothetical protein EAF00_007338 [Botryotinia globosa]|nr:hypothetical protein EAF00_007338 [Botryotinia globosa]